MSVKQLRVNSVGFGDGHVLVWALPLWLKSDALIQARLTPREARQLAVKLLNAADVAGDDR